MASRTLPLELAASFLAPSDAAAVASVCRALRGVAADDLYWKEHYARRYPALASLPGLGQPSNARELVRNLLTALPPPPTPRRRGRGRQPLPVVPRDAEGRALPLRGDAVLAVQLLRRGAPGRSPGEPPSLGRQRPVASGSVRLADANLHEVEHPPAPEWENDWKFNVRLRLDCADGRRSLRDAFALPESIPLDPEHPLRNTEPPFPDVVRHHVLTFDRDFRQELYIVAGDAIYRLDQEEVSCSGSLDDALADYNSGVLFPCQLWAERGTLDPEMVPGLRMRVEYEDLNAVVTSRWNVADYDLASDERSFELTWHAPITMEFHASWEKWGFYLYDERVDVDGPGPEGWNYFCRLLAAARPVAFPRGQAEV